MTNLEKVLIHSVIIAHRMGIFTTLIVDKLEQEDKIAPENLEELREALNVSSGFTFPLAVLVGDNNARALADSIFNFSIDEKDIVEFIENNLSADAFTNIDNYLNTLMSEEQEE